MSLCVSSQRLRTGCRVLWARKIGDFFTRNDEISVPDFVVEVLSDLDRNLRAPRREIRGLRGTRCQREYWIIDAETENRRAIRGRERLVPVIAEIRFRRNQQSSCHRVSHSNPCHFRFECKPRNFENTFILRRSVHHASRQCVTLRPVPELRRQRRSEDAGRSERPKRLRRWGGCRLRLTRRRVGFGCWRNRCVLQACE